MDELDKYLSENPHHGMPYGFPALKKEEHNLIITWLKDEIKDDREKSNTQSKYIEEFEEFLNNPKIKYQVTARYIYEHLFLAHIKFKDDDSFYSLVRSYDNDVKELVKTRVPYGKTKEKFYYKFKKNRFYYCP